MEFRVTVDLDEFGSREGPKILYSDKEYGATTPGKEPRRPDAASLRVPVSGLLSAHGVEGPSPEVHSGGSVPVLYPGDGNQEHSGLNSPGRYGFDIFAAVFYMISRLEEYLPFRGDRYGRFEAGESLAWKHGFIELPVVDLWLEDFRQELERRFKGLRPVREGFRFQPSCDIDLPYAFLHRGPLRTMGAGLRAVLREDREERALRRRVLRGEARDPFDTFAEIDSIHSRAGLRPKFFFLTAKYGRYDKSISPRGEAFAKLVRQTMKYADPGIHPSYGVRNNFSELAREVKALSGICGEQVTRSRQHYLRFGLPGSYRDCISAGILEDFSMGYASAAGFRAGTARSFLFYDLLKEEETGLRVFPFQVMDRTLKDYMKLGPAEALDRILSLSASVRRTGGTFCTIWHNDAFSDHGEWNGWKSVYLQLIEALSE